MTEAGTPSRCAGVVATACTQGKHTQHGSPLGGIRDGQPDAREGQTGRRGETEGFVVPLKPGNAGGGKGPQFKTDARRSEGPGDWATYQLRRVFRNCRRRCTRKRRQKPAIAFMLCTTRSAVKTSWPMPMRSAAPTRAHRGWTVRTSRTSKRMGYSGGLANWRLRSCALDLSFTDEQRARLQQVSAITLGLPARNATPAVHRSIHRRRHGFASTDVVVQRGARQLGGTRWTPDAT